MEKNRKVICETPIQLLWTGGWDSSFRLVELSRMPVTVQPIYLFGDGRRSKSYELRAMQEILELLWNHSETRAEILPLKMVDIATVPQNQRITDAYNNITKQHKLGSQYEWIARYAAINPGVELCSEKPHDLGIGYMQTLIVKEGRICQTHDVHEFRVESDSEDVMCILGNVFFPIKGKTERDMLNLINQWGYKDVMSHIWFCHAPLNGAPCGMCRPCCEKVESDMSFLLDDEALRRNITYKYLGKKCSKLYEIIMRKIFAVRDNKRKN